MEPPYSISLHPSHYPSHCQHCASETQNPVPCQSCSSVGCYSDFLSAFLSPSRTIGFFIILLYSVLSSLLLAPDMGTMFYLTVHSPSYTRYSSVVRSARMPPPATTTTNAPSSTPSPPRWLWGRWECFFTVQ